MAMQHYSGGCHCGSIKFEVDADLESTIICNCSLCSKTGAILTFVPASQFTLLSGEENLTDYQFSKKIIHHLFCKTCGMRPFGRGVGPDGSQMVAVNARCLDGVDALSLKPTFFDGASR